MQLKSEIRLKESVLPEEDFSDIAVEEVRHISQAEILDGVAANFES